MWNLLLLLGFASAPSAEVTPGICYNFENEGTPCALRTQQHGTRYIYASGKTYKFRPVFWNVYELSIDGIPVTTAHCRVKDANQYCLNSITFISSNP